MISIILFHDSTQHADSTIRIVITGYIFHRKVWIKKYR